MVVKQHKHFGLIVMLCLTAVLTSACFKELEDVPPLPIETTGIFDTEPTLTLDLAANDTLVSAPLLTEDAIILHTQRAFVAYDRTSGDILWRTLWPSQDERVLPPLQTAEEVVSQGGDNQLAVMDPASGQILKTLDIGTDIVSLSSTADSMIYATDTGNVVGVDVNSGREQWRFPKPIDDGLDILSRGDFYYVNSSAGVSYVEAQSGRVRWTTKMWDKGGTIALNPVTDILYVAAIMPDLTLHILAINLNNQALLWDAPIPDTDIEIRAQLAASEYRLYEASDQQGRLMAIDASSGGIEWLSPRLYGSPSQPVVGVGLVLVQDDVQLYAFNEMDGTLAGTLTLTNGAQLKQITPTADELQVIVPISPTRVEVYALPSS